MTHISESGDYNREHSLKCEIAAEALRSFGSLRLRVAGHSMLPVIWPGDTLVIGQCKFAEIVPGDIVLYSRHQRLVIHRVLQAIDTQGDPSLLTQGDALPHPDAPVFPVQVLGRVTEIIREGQPLHAPAIPSAPAGRVACILRHSAFLSRLLVHLRMRRRNSGNCEVLCQV